MACVHNVSQGMPIKVTSSFMPLVTCMTCHACEHMPSDHLYTSFHKLPGRILVDSKLVQLFPSHVQGITDTRRHLPDAVSRVPLLRGSLPLCGASPSHSRGPHTARTSLPGQLAHRCCQPCSVCLSAVAVWLSVCLPVCLSVSSCCLSLLAVCLSVRPSVRPSVYRCRLTVADC